MKVYILYESSVHLDGRRDTVVGVYSTQKKAEKALKNWEADAMQGDTDYTYNVIPEKVR